MSRFEEFHKDNDNVALFSLGLLEIIREQALIDRKAYVGGQGDNAAEAVPLNFRLRWQAVEQNTGGKRDIAKISEFVTIPTLRIEYVPDSIYFKNHTASLDPLGDELDLHEDDVLALERMASQHETEVILLG